LLVEVGGALAAEFTRFHRLPHLSDYERGLNRQLGGCQPECFARQCLVYPVHLVEHLAGLNFRHVVLRIALAVTHAHFRRLSRNRFVRENADPNPPAALDMARHGAARRLDLTRGQTAATNGLQAVLTEAHLGAAGRHTGVAAFLFLAVLSSSWLQHSGLLVLLFSPAQALAPPRAARRGQAFRP